MICCGDFRWSGTPNHLASGAVRLLVFSSSPMAAPMHQQAPPARAVASAPKWHAARGTLLLMTGTACSVAKWARPGRSVLDAACVSLTLSA